MKGESIIQTSMAAIRSALAYLVISTYVLITAPLGRLIYLFTKSNSALYLFGHIGVTVGLWLTGVKCRVVRFDNSSAGRTAVYCSNHQSNLDPPILYHLLHPRLHLLYKAELARLPLLGPAFGPGGFIAVDRKNKEQALASIDEAARSLQSGNSFLTFPEGTRSRTDDLLPFKAGGFIMAIKAQVPIIPVAVVGGRNAMERGGHIIRPVTVTVCVGEPIETSGLRVEDRGTLMRTVYDRIAQLIREAIAIP